MGSANSKVDRNEALRLCKARKKFIKQGIESRYALAAAHISYIESLRNTGVALRRYAEAESLIESSLSTSATELEKTPSHSSYPSPSPSHIVDLSDSSLNNASPLSPPTTRMSFMKSGGTTSVTISFNPLHNTRFLDDDPVAFALPPPPPPLSSDYSGSWDFFDPIDENESFRFVGHGGVEMSFDSFGGWSQFKGEKVNDLKVNLSESDEFHDARAELKSEPKDYANFGDLASRSDGHSIAAEGISKSITSGALKGVSEQGSDTEVRPIGTECKVDELVKSLQDKASVEHSGSKREKPASKDLCTQREDPSEFITHRAKDFLASIKDIGSKFSRASESGKEVTRMLEGNKIRVRFTEEKGQSSSSALLGAFQNACCRQKPLAFVSHDPGQHGKKVIIWKRTTSSQSASSRNPLNAAPKDDVSDSGSDFFDDFCMISGSHSSTLERLYAWERKLYDEVKASESIRKVYDKKCNQLRHQFAKGCSTNAIDRTRAVVKDLHSRIQVALHSVDSISKRIEKMRDEELFPQLIELIQGFIRMWKAMLECHHAQYITISLAYHSKGALGASQHDTWRQIMDQLQQEIECFGLSFANWINSLTSYVEALNGWLQHCILHEPERSKHRRPWSPRRVVAPPIFVLFRDWSAGIKALPSSELNDAIRGFLLDLVNLVEQQAESQGKQKPADVNDTGGSERKDEEKDDFASYTSCMQASLIKVLDRLTKFSEASLKMHEDIRQKTETAGNTYSNSRPARSKSV